MENVLLSTGYVLIKNFYFNTTLTYVRTTVYLHFAFDRLITKSFINNYNIFLVIVESNNNGYTVDGTLENDVL